MYLCHFVFSTKQYTSSAEVVEELQKYIPSYGKSISGMYEKTKALASTACENAVRLEKYCEKNGFAVHTTEFMPSTDVYHIVDELHPEES